ncbi:helix-turn-helix transcriptional regulator [Neptunomonas sp.]|uniref:helix-turn-helix transcriptional regulator n=1 Tax=Neptunomonas TaxID=75687 RepID=UPI0035180A36
MTTRLLRRPEVEKLVGLSRSTIYTRLEQGTFPKPIPLGGRLVAWVESDIHEWIESRIKAGRVNDEA